jgi:hypothetical protein
VKGSVALEIMNRLHASITCISHLLAKNSGASVSLDQAKSWRGNLLLAELQFALSVPSRSNMLWTRHARRPVMYIGSIEWEKEASTDGVWSD